MATKRTKLKRPVRRRITPEAVAAFRRGDSYALDRALGLRPWQESPLAADSDDPPDWMRDAFSIERWKEAREIRRELEKAAAQ